MNPLVKHIAERAKLKMESATSLTDTPVMQIPATVIVQMANDIEARENHIVYLSIQNSDLSMKTAHAERRLMALTKLVQQYIPADLLEEQLENVK